MKRIIWGDCLIEMDRLIKEGVKIDAIICDPPYGTTACKWDSVINFETMWEKCYKLLRPNGFIIMNASQPFSSQLVNSNIKNFSHQWIWEKVGSNGNPLLANKMPLKNFEDIMIFSNEMAKHDFDNEHPVRDRFYNQYINSNISNSEYTKILGNGMAGHYFTKGVQFTLPTLQNYKKLQTTGFFKKDWEELNIQNIEFKKYLIDKLNKKYPRIYNPQMTEGKSYTIKQSGMGEAFGGKTNDNIITENNGERYPKSIIKFGFDKDKFHPTQKPVALMEYLIKTYTNEGDLILDFTAGSFSTCVAAENTGRNWIGIEQERDYIEVGKERLKDVDYEDYT